MKTHTFSQIQACLENAPVKACIAPVLYVASVTAALAQNRGRLRVSDKHRYLPYEDGTPFLYMAATVIQAVALAELEGPCAPNPYGDLPLSEKPAKAPEYARQYRGYLGPRYKDKPVIWIPGGDETITGNEDRAILDALAEGLGKSDGGVP